MPRTFHAHRLDANHKTIKEELIAAGAFVLDTAQVGLSIDMIVLLRGTTLYVEIKNPERLSKAQLNSRRLALTDDELTLRDEIIHKGGEYLIAISSEEILEWVSYKEAEMNNYYGQEY